MNGECVIEVRDLHRHFRVGDETVRALNGVSLAIDQSEFFGLTGPSGSGKSTLLYLLGGLDRPTQGEIRVLNKDLNKLNENELARFRGREVGFIYQSFHLLPSMTALQNVELPMIFQRTTRAERRRWAVELLEMVGLGERLHHRPPQMSGGQRQRVAIARALTNRPGVLLCDEPTGNLDSRNGMEIVRLLADLARKQNVTVVIVSHDATVIGQTDRCVQITDGKIFQES